MILDILFIALFCWAAYKGYTKGFILQAATLAALILGLYGAVRFSHYTETFIREKWNLSGQYLPLVSYAVTFIAIVLAIHFLAKLAEKLFKLTALSFINRIFGVFFNLIKYALLISAALVVVNTANRKLRFIPPKTQEESKLYTPLSSLAPLLFPYLHFDFSHPAPVKNEKDEVLV